MTRDRPLFILIMVMFAAVPAASRTHAKVSQDPDCSPLTVGERYERELAKGEAHCYRLRLQSGQFAMILAEQLSTSFPNNLLLRRMGPAGDTVALKTNRQLGPEVSSFVADRTGAYRFEVTRIEHRQGPADGPYAVWVEAILDPEEQAARTAELAADPRVAWLEENVVPLRSLDPEDDDFSDLMPLADALHGVQVVALGEPTHGTGAAFLAKTRVMKFLHQELGYDVLVWESGMLDMELASRALAAGADPHEALELGVFGIWLDSDQMRPLIDYLGQARHGDHPIELAGVDLQFSGAPADSILGAIRRYLAGRDVPAAELEEGGEVTTVLGHVVDYRYLSGQEPPPDSMQQTRLLAALERWETAADTGSTERDRFWARAFRTARTYVEQVFHQLDLAARDAGEDEWRRLSQLRDRVMGQNLAWLADRRYPDRKIMVWAATAHLLRNPDPIAHARASEAHPVYADGFPESTMGHEAARQLGDRMYVLPVIAAEGVHGKDTWIGYPYHVVRDQIDRPELEALIMATGYDPAFLDLRAVRGSWNDVFGGPLIGRGLDRFIPWEAAWSQHADGLLYLREMTPSTTELDSSTRPVRVVFDQGHFNYHTPETYTSLLRDLEPRGYEVSTSTGTITRGALRDVDILMIVSPLAEDRDTLIARFGRTWSHTERANRSAFTEDEIAAIGAWVAQGGALFLVSDHYPYGRSIESLAEHFGVNVHGGLVTDPANAVPGTGGNWIRFSRENGLLADHPITDGGPGRMGVDTVLVYTGQSLRGPPHSAPLLTLSESARHGTPPVPPDTTWEWESATGRAMALVLCHGQGRVFVSGEAGVFANPNQGTADNADFALNTMAWLKQKIAPNGC